MKRILVINGPNLNMLGRRPKEHYGSKTLDEINNMIKEFEPNYEFVFYQSNHEGTIIDRIQENDYDAIIINPGAYTHTSVAIHDALEIVDKIIVEVHLSDVFNRDDFRKIDFIKSVASTCITGLHEYSYIEAVKYLQKNL